MRTHRPLALLAVAAGCLALAGCDPQAADTGPAPGAPATTRSAAAPPKAGKTAAVVPDFVGQILQGAQDGAQAAGFYLLSSHDALGKNRNQVLDRNWKVCTQTPAAGTATSTDTRIDFGTVKNEEVCP
ncbi:hypothetical protein ACIQZO_28410 [Streptomyces sp. NPDC097617]|uniref:hypothetical protein n=1 Tax=Streptomyces sp. NPDC097617 TaxID=3366091 RepID=UPI00382123AF